LATAGVLSPADLLGDLFDFFAKLEGGLRAVDELLNELGVEVVAGLPGDVDCESGGLLVEGIFFAADEFEHAGHLGEGELLQVAFVEGVLEVEAGDGTCIRGDQPTASTPKPTSTAFEFMIAIIMANNSPSADA
jgi:hypothetical protein